MSVTNTTIATHNGTKMSREHNIRNRNVTDKEKHIDRNGIHETGYDEKIRVAYQRIFGEAVAKYNEKQTREDRKITNYFRDVCKDASKNPAYELIVGVYNPDVPTELKKEILKEYFDTWKARNPNLILIGAYYHFDEEGKDPHIHLDYIPIGHGYKKGMEMQVGLNRALWEQDGFSTTNRHDTAQVKWEKKENAYLESLCVARGLTVAHPMRDKAKHIETEEYKALKRIETAKEEFEKIKLSMEEIKKEIDSVRAEYEAKKEYVKEFSKDFHVEGVKEKKDFKGKSSFIVPGDVWRMNQILQKDIEAQEKAQKEWERLIEYYPQLVKDSEIISASNEKLKEDIRKMEAAVQHLSPEAKKEFWNLYNAKVEHETEELNKKVFGEETEH